MIKLPVSLVLFLICITGSHLVRWQSKLGRQQDFNYLFFSFRDTGYDGLHISYSLDGLTWQAINQDNTLLSPFDGEKLMRDPYSILGSDNVYHMVWSRSDA